MFVRRVVSAAAALMILAAAPASAETDFAFDPSTGFFRPAPKVAAASGQSRAAVSRSGRYEITINVTQSYPAPAGAKPTCNATVSAFGAAGTAYQESGTYVAAAGSGGAWRCKVIIPYSWPQVEATMPVNLTIMVYSGNEGSKARTHMRILPAVQLPADGAVTKITHAVTL
jgi:hypothetical protein